MNSFRPSGLPYLRMFFVTLMREWTGIDRLRMDKYYLLIKKFLEETVKYLVLRNWNQKDVEKVSKIIGELPLCVDEEKLVFGVASYITEQYLDVIKNTLQDQEIDANSLFLLIRPYISYLATCPNTILTQKVYTNVFKQLTEDDYFKERIPHCSLNISQKFEELSSKSQVIDRNRKLLNQLALKFQQLSVPAALNEEEQTVTPAADEEAVSTDNAQKTSASEASQDQEEEQNGQEEAETTIEPTRGILKRKKSQTGERKKKRLSFSQPLQIGRT
eukprot:TRINITY_DN2923_c0_g1_i1.p1 TRINITY_DN2923_c0_g1~~TRINITY_DN2923_c0_g1_i1.p1  ORF type:complete len:274 (-),score=56.58 TRINITY_DN2923_c0_g1_i1:110-931(-)